MNDIKHLTLSFLVLLIAATTAYSQSNLVVDTTLTAEQLIKKILLQGDNIKVENIKYNGHPSAIGRFEIDEERSFKLKNGIILSSGRASSVRGRILVLHCQIH